MRDFWIYLAILAGSTYLIRAIPFAALQKKIKSRFVRSFLYYIPYAVLAAMTFPAALYATGHIFSAAAGLLTGGVFAFKGKGLTFVAVVSCVAALIVELLLKFVFPSVNF
ncbi:MAG: AzlD domain-containing protein [Ruminococcaceae bacterium]|nr:AzlD domain-containing protein [Oscillospiraceae bacterium]